MIDSVAGIISAAPMPWSGRPAMSHVCVWAKPMNALRGREHHDADEEDRAAAEDVAEPPAGDEQDAEGERVGVDRPLEPRDRRVEVALDRRQRDVHDGVVEHHHEQREAHRAERPPAAVVVVEPAGARHRPASRSSRTGAGRRGAACAARDRCAAAKASSASRRASSRRCTRSRPASVIDRRFTGGRRRPPGGRAARGRRARRRRGWRRGATGRARSASSLTVSSPSAAAVSALTCVKLRSSRSNSPIRRLLGAWHARDDARLSASAAALSVCMPVACMHASIACVYAVQAGLRPTSGAQAATRARSASSSRSVACSWSHSAGSRSSYSRVGRQIVQAVAVLAPRDADLRVELREPTRDVRCWVPGPSSAAASYPRGWTLTRRRTCKRTCRSSARGATRCG